MLDRDEVIDIAKYHQEFEKQKERSQTYLTGLQNEFNRHGVESETRLAYGSVVKAILTTATNTCTNLIAMATHGLSGLARVSFGSVAAGVLQAAELPILLIRSCNDQKAETCG